MKMINLKEGSGSNGHYSSGVISSNLLFISGMLSLDPKTGKAADGDIREHMQLALLKVEQVLKEASLCTNDVVQCRIYTTDIGSWEEINEVFAGFFGSHRPARIVVPVSSLHYGCKVEIEAVAEVR